ncbi:Polyprenyl synthetase [Trema orientale]|uniref:Polyprenyl synthetase n=1 Tax=Trema orientale TaxID=63057 RepID=A0A2P5F2E8_TREOI|nr:Polyprenyl synthetase [Trema orientale]
MALYNLQYINGSPRFHHHSHFVPRSPSRSNSLRHVTPMKITKITMSRDHNQSSYCASITADIEAHLKQSITLKPPLSVFEPMYHLVFSAPPNSAPALCVAACELVGGRRSQAIAAASALHLMHAASFTHEHLLLTDRPNSKPMVHHAYGPNIELLIPDAIVPFGCELLARSDDPAQNDSDRVLRVIVEITRAIGSRGIIDGQYQEKVVSRSNGDEMNDDNNEWIDYTCRKKEGGLHACAAACGAILGGANEEEIEILRKFGLYVGMIQGYSTRIGSKGKELERVVEELRNLALKELEHFKGRKVEAISSFILGL